MQENSDKHMTKQRLLKNKGTMKNIMLLALLMLIGMACLSISAAKDYKDVKALQTSSKENEDPEFQFNQGEKYFGGKEVPRDYKKAAEWFTKAAEQGHVKAQQVLGTMYDVGKGIPQDYKKAVVWYAKAAAQNDAASECLLASLYYQGLGVAQDYQKAAELNTKAAEQGHTSAQVALGTMYFKGAGVPQNWTEGLKWVIIACENSSGAQSEECVKLRNYMQSRMNAKHVAQAKKEAEEFNVRQNASLRMKAVEQIAKAAARGAADQQFIMGEACEHGLTVPQDYKKAFEWYTKAANQSYAKAQAALGTMYYLGKGVPKNSTEALKWFILACENSTGDELNKYSEIRDSVQTEMTPRQIAQAKKRAAEFKLKK